MLSNILKTKVQMTSGHFSEYGTNGSSIRKASDQKAFEQRCYER